MSVFAVHDASCDACVFAPLAGVGTEQLVSFVRLNSTKNGYAPIQNSSGELVLSYVPIGTLLCDIQPKAKGYPYQQQGVVAEADYLGIFAGNADIRYGDRCYLSNLQLQCVKVDHWGGEHLEIELAIIGR